MNLFDTALEWNGYPVGRATVQLQNLLQQSVGQRLETQNALRSHILQHHASQNDFYRKHITANGLNQPPALEDWHTLPVLEKQDFQLPLPQMLSRGFSTGMVFRNNTSGSSGVPFHFAKDKWCHAMSWANNKRLFALHDIDFNKDLQARFYGMPMSGIKYYKERLKDKLSHRLRFPVHQLDKQSSMRYLDKFRRMPFAYINGYTSSLVLFARFILEQGLVLKDICPTLKACFTTSEMCDEIDREIMLKAFGVKVVNEYGAAELELLAFEYPDGAWVVNEENLFLEILDENNQSVPEGKTGKIVVTSLHNKAMPFIRYHIGDTGAILPGQKVGFNRVLQSLSGRTNDMALLPSGKKVPGLAFYYMTKAIIDKGGHLKEVVVKQTGKDIFEIIYIRNHELTSGELQQIQKLMATYLEPGLRLRTNRVDRIQRTAAGKLRQFENMLPQ